MVTGGSDLDDGLDDDQGTEELDIEEPICCHFYKGFVYKEIGLFLSKPW